jgi:hypothetical protein
MESTMNKKVIFALILCKLSSGYADDISIMNDGTNIEISDTEEENNDVIVNDDSIIINKGAVVNDESVNINNDDDYIDENDIEEEEEDNEGNSLRIRMGNGISVDIDN